jgi:hypothetical protein
VAHPDTDPIASEPKASAIIQAKRVMRNPGFAVLKSGAI